MTATDTRLAIAVAPYSPAQVAKALDLIARSGLTPTERSGLYRAASSDGTTSHLACSVTCSCPAPGPCYHMAAVALIEAHSEPEPDRAVADDVFARIEASNA